MDIRLTRSGTFGALLPALAFVAGVAGPASAQAVDGPRLDRLKDAVQTETSLVEAESFEGDKQLLTQLEELRDEVGYLRVMRRRGAAVDERECRQVESRLLEIRNDVRRADAKTGGRRPPAAVLEIPLGAEFDVRVPLRLMPDGPTPQAFEAATVDDLRVQGHVVIPAGSVVRGTVRRLNPVSNTDSRSGLVVTLRMLTVRERTYEVDMRVVRVLGADDRRWAIESDDGDGSTLVAIDHPAVDLAAGSTFRIRAGAAIELTQDR